MHHYKMLRCSNGGKSFQAGSVCLFKYVFLFNLSFCFFSQSGSGSTNDSEILIDLVGLDGKTPSQPEPEPQASSLGFSGDLLCGTAPAELRSKSAAPPSAALSLLDEELLSLGTFYNQMLASSFSFFQGSMRVFLL